MKKLVILIFVFLVYLLTLPKDIGLGDSGTLAAAAVNWGVPHPPGFPSYVLIAHWFSYLPWGSMAQKLALVSVLASVATVGLVMEMAGIIPALILAFSYGFWSQAVNVETYALTNLVIILVSYLSFPRPMSFPRRRESIWRWIPAFAGMTRRWIPAFAGMTNKSVWRGIMLGVIGGIGVGLNPIVVGVTPSVVSIPLFAGYGSFPLRKGEGWRMITVVIVVAMAIYSYLPIRASQHPFLNWSDPSTIERFFRHVTGGGLSVVSSTAVNGFTGSFYWLINSFGRFIYIFFVETLGVGMILTIIGGYFMFKRDRKSFWYWIVLVLTNVILAGIYVSGNRDSWYVMGMIGGMMLLRSFPRPMSFPRRRESIWRWIPAFAGMTKIVGMTGVVLLLMVWGPRMWERARSNYVGTYINDLYKDLPEKAILIGGGETFNSLTLYAHEAIKLRPDVTPVDFSIFYGQKWYRENMDSRLRGNDGGGGNDKVETAKFTDEGEFGRILEQFVEANKDRPIFISGYLLRRPIYGGSLNPAYVPERYQLVQKGIVYQLVPVISTEAKRSGEIPLSSERDPSNPASSGARDDNSFYLESNYLKAVEDIQLDYGLALEMRGDFFGAARVAPKYFDQNRLNIKIKELNSVK